ncbi:ABC transporter ATP-binding protein [Ramlibacter sp. MMS24-I3-19]|uniref:ABC transporter ATP-binding protein n=1 Tax=Ramlibacter sp. MMS24-I3-19 TaxID=3416606 RepID=UPI003D0141A8
MLLADDLTFAYPGSPRTWTWNLEIQPGLTLLQGANGSGKSTLLKVLAGGLRPSTGSLRLDGLDAFTDGLDYRRNVFWCGPGPTPFGHLTGHEFLGFMRGLYPAFSLEGLDAHAGAFGLAPFLDRPIRSLSTGTQKKLWITAALQARTRVTLIDEPLIGLDAASRAHAIDALASEMRARSGDIFLVASHEPLDLEPRSIVLA